jgi:type IV pilus assembly protein PilF
MKFNRAFAFCIAPILLNLFGCAFFSSRDKDTSDLYLKIGIGHLESGRYPQALSAFLAAEKVDPNNPLVQNNLGLAYFVRDKFDLAENHIRRAISIKSDFSDAKNNLGRVLIEKNQIAEAVTVLQEVMNDLTYVNPEKPLFNLGLAYFKLKRHREAREHFRKSLEIQKDNCLASNYYGRSLFELKEYFHAAEALDRAIGYCNASQFDEPQYFSGLAYYEIGEVDKSLARLDELLKLYPNGKYRAQAKAMLKNLKRNE